MPGGWDQLWPGVLIAAAAALVWYARRPGRDPWLGPLFRYELVKLARRGQQPKYRAVYVGCLLLALFGLYAHEFGEDAILSLAADGVTKGRDATARFAETYLILFLFAQTVAVLVLTPAVVGGAIAGERDSGTFDLLRASPLSNRELALGGLAAGLVSVGSVAAAGIPVLALTLLFGGVDVVVLASGCAATAFGAVSLGAYTAWLATARKRLGEVLLTAYSVAGASAVIGLCLGWVPGLGAASPLSAQAYTLYATKTGGVTGYDLWINIGGCLGLHGLFAAWFAGRAVREVRRPATREPLGSGKAGRKNASPKRKESPHPKERPSEGTEADDLPTPVHARRGFVVVPLRDDENPLRWKERYFSGRPGGVEENVAEGCGLFAAGITAFVFGSWLVVAAVGVLVEGWEPGRSVTPPVRVIAVGGVLMAGLAGGVAASGSVARERERNALESLFVLPVGRAAVLRAKRAAAVERAFPWAATAGSVSAIGLFTGGVHPVGFLAVVALTAGYVWFGITLGLWASVRARTVPAASIRLVLGMLVGWIIPVFASLWLPDGLNKMAAGMSPPFGLWQGLFDWQVDWTNVGSPAVVGGLLGGGGYALAGLFLWKDAVRRFEREGRGELP